MLVVVFSVEGVADRRLGFGDVLMSGWRSPRDGPGAVRRLGGLPSGFVLQGMIGRTEMRKVVVVGTASVGPVSGVVDVGMDGGSAATREPARSVPHLEHFAKGSGDLVPVLADGEYRTGFRMSEDTDAARAAGRQFPGGVRVDGPVSIEVTGLFAHAEEGEHRHGHQQIGLDATESFRRRRARAARTVFGRLVGIQDEIAEHIGSQLRERARLRRPLQ